jgi:hypothetical protein
MALSPKAGDVYLSKGLLEITGETSDQLLFVITHELAHGILGHFNESCALLPELEREKKADEYALLYLYRKAKRYHDIPELLKLLMRSSQLDEKGRLLLQERAANLSAMIGKLH